MQEITDVTVNMAIVDPDMNQLQIVLVPPTGSGLPELVLVENQTNNAGVTNTGVGLTGANLGVAPDGEAIGTIFDDNATRNIFNVTNAGINGSAGPYIGFYQPEGGSLDQNYAGADVNTGAAGTRGSINGTWTIRITDFVNSTNSQFLENASLNFTSGFSPGIQSNVTTTHVRAAASGAATALNASPASRPAPLRSSPRTTPSALIVPMKAACTSPTSTVIASSETRRTTPTSSWPTRQRRVDLERRLQPLDRRHARQRRQRHDRRLLARERRRQHRSRAVRTPTSSSTPSPAWSPLSWYDTRYDAENDLASTETATSIDGGQTYSTNVYANDSETATNTITANTVNLSPIPDNLANAASGTDGVAGFGVHQGLAVYDGHLYPIWTSNENGGSGGNQPMGIRTNVGTFYSGPAVASVTQGPIGGPNDDLNTQTATDGTPELTEFEVTFTGPVDPTSFTPSDVRVYYRDTTPDNTTGGYVPISSITPLNANSFGRPSSSSRFPRSGVGTYSVTVLATNVSNDIRSIQSVVTAVGAPVSFSQSNIDETVYPTARLIRRSTYRSAPVRG